MPTSHMLDTFLQRNDPTKPSTPFQMLKQSIWQSKAMLESSYMYQAQILLAKYEGPVPRGQLVTTPTEVAKLIDGFGGRGVLRSPILAGGHGKGVFDNAFKNNHHAHLLTTTGKWH